MKRKVRWDVNSARMRRQRRREVLSQVSGNELPGGSAGQRRKSGGRQADSAGLAMKPDSFARAVTDWLAARPFSEAGGTSLTLPPSFLIRATSWADWVDAFITSSMFDMTFPSIARQPSEAERPTRRWITPSDRRNRRPKSDSENTHPTRFPLTGCSKCGGVWIGRG